MSRLLNALIGLLVWPLTLYQVIACYLGSETAINQIKNSKTAYMQERQFWLNVEPIICGLLAYGLIYSGWIWTGLYIAMGALSALIYERAARRL